VCGQMMRGGRGQARREQRHVTDHVCNAVGHISWLLARRTYGPVCNVASAAGPIYLYTSSTFILSVLMLDVRTYGAVCNVASQQTPLSARDVSSIHS
jgi:hypothetical protein